MPIAEYIDLNPHSDYGHCHEHRVGTIPTQRIVNICGIKSIKKIK